MSRTLLCCLCSLLCAILLAPQSSLAQAGNMGRSFVLSLPYSYPAGKYFVPNPQLVLRAGDSAATVTLTGHGNGQQRQLTIPPNTATVVGLDSTWLMLPKLEGKFTATTGITASHPVSATLIFDRVFTTEAYQAIPDTLLGLEYVVCIPPEVAFGTAAAIAAVHDRTELTITPTVITYNGHKPQESFKVELNRGEVYQLMSDGDFSGTTIVASKPVGVIAGAPAADFTMGAIHSGNPAFEQLPATDTWGTEHVAAPLARQYQSLYRIVAAFDGTRIDISPSLGGVQLTATLNRGGFYDLRYPGLLQFSSNNPVLVSQMVTSTAWTAKSRDSAYGDPGMVIVPPTSMWGNSAAAYAPTLAPRVDIGPVVAWKHHLLVATRAPTITGVRINGLAPSWSSLISFGGMAVGVAEVEEGDNRVTATDSFSIIAHGYSAADAYGYTPGAVVRASPLELFSIERAICGDQYDTTITLRNLSGQPVRIDRVEFAGNLSGQVLSPPLAITLEPGESFPMRLRFTGIYQLGRNNGSLVLWHDAPYARRVAVFPVQFWPDVLTLAPGDGSRYQFGAIPPTIPFIDTVVTIFNGGQRTIRVDAQATGGVTILSPPFPLDLPPLNARTVRLRYAPPPEGKGEVRFFTANCLTPQTITLEGVRGSIGFLQATVDRAIQLLCPPKLSDTLRVELANKGDKALDIREATVVGANGGEFFLIDDPTGTTLQPNDSRTIRVEYRPNGTGARDAQLRLVNSGGNDTLILPFDVRNDTLLLKPQLDTLRFGRTSACDPFLTRTVVWRNEGARTIDTVRFFADGTLFQLTPQIATGIRPGDSVAIIVDLLARASGNLSGALTAEVTPCRALFALPITGWRDPIGLSINHDTLDFGEIGWCNFQRVDSIVITNTGSRAEVIELAALPTNGGVSLSYTTLPPFTIQPGGAAKFYTTFRPTAIGEYRDQIAIKIRGCSFQFVVPIRGVYDNRRPQLVDSLVDFGGVMEGGSDERIVRIANNSFLTYRYNPAALQTAFPDLTVVDPLGPIEVKPGDTLKVRLRYAPTDSLQTLNEQLSLAMFAPCRDTARARIIGFSVERPSGIRLRWGNVRGDVGGRVVIPLLSTSAKPINEPITLQASVSFDGRLFFPTGVAAPNPAIAVRLVGNVLASGRRTVAIEAAGIFPDSGEVAGVEGVILLGPTDTTTLNFGPPGPVASLSTRPAQVMDTLAGGLKVDGFCREGDARLVGTGALLKMELAPQPATDRLQVRFDLLEDGHTTLRLLGQTGEELRLLSQGPLQHGAYRAEFPLDDLPSGIHYLELRTPTERLVVRCVLVR